MIKINTPKIPTPSLGGFNQKDSLGDMLKGGIKYYGGNATSGAPKAPELAKVDTGGVDSAKEALQAQGSQAQQILAGMKDKPITAERLEAPQAVNAAQLAAPQAQIGTTAINETGQGLGGAKTVDAAQVNMDALKANQAVADKAAYVGDVNAAQIAPLGTLNAAQVGPAAQIQNAGQLTPAQVEAAQQNEIRQRQFALANMLQGQAEGTGPSLAAMQLKQANDRAIAQQAALVGATRGGNLGLAQKQAAENVAALGQQNAQAAAQLKIQEQQNAMNQLGGLLQGTRESDIGLAAKQAELQQQAGLTQYTTQADVNKTQAQLEQEAALRQAGFQQEANTTAYKTEAERAQAQAQLQQQAALANQQAKLNTALENARLGTQVNMQNAETMAKGIFQQAEMNQQAILANQQAINQRDEQIAKLKQDAQIANRQISSQEQQTIAKLEQERNLFKADQENKIALANADAAQRTAIANQAADLQAKGMQADQIAKMMGISQDALVANLQAEGQIMNAKVARDTAKFTAQNSLSGGLIAGGSAMGAAALLSDMNKKKNIKSMYAKGTLVKAKSEDEKPEVKGDSKKNDKIDVKVSDGEMIIPRSVVQEGPDAIKSFAAHILSKGKQGTVEERNAPKKSFGEIMAACGGKMKAADGGVVTQDDLDKKERKEKIDQLNSLTKGLGAQKDMGSGFASMGASIADIMIKSQNKEKTAAKGGLASTGGGVVEKSSEMDAFLDSLNPYSYEYKNPKEEGAAPGQRYGILSQEVASTPVGATIVKDTPKGKMIDVTQSIGVILASLGALNKKIGKVK